MAGMAHVTCFHFHVQKLVFKVHSGGRVLRGGAGSAAGRMGWEEEEEEEREEEDGVALRTTLKARQTWEKKC